MYNTVLYAIWSLSVGEMRKGGGVAGGSSKGVHVREREYHLYDGDKQFT